MYINKKNKNKEIRLSIQNENMTNIHKINELVKIKHIDKLEIRKVAE